MLRFSDELEAKFEETTGPARCKRLWLEGLLSLTVFNLVLVAAAMMHPDVQRSELLLKLFLFNPLALMVNALMRLNPDAWVREASITLVTVLMAFGMLSFELNRSEPDALIAEFTVGILALFSNSVMRLQVRYAVIVSTSLVIGEIAFAIVDHVQSSNNEMVGLCLTLAVLLFSMIANYSHNREARLNFLFCLRGDLLVEGLSRLNDDLVHAAEEDGLTGLANRRAFDRRMIESWEEASEMGLVLAVILIDIDHFKRLNDRFGHLYGDRVLQRVGRLLQESLRKKEDFAARFGGEEFVILLPGTEKDKAILVAERLRQLVEVAGLPALDHGRSMEGGYAATVSCGVASGSPLQFEDLQSFLDCADKALYRAKAFGRNTVCFAPECEAPLLASTGEPRWAHSTP